MKKLNSILSVIAIITGVTSNIHAQELPYGSKLLYRAAICSNCWGGKNTSAWQVNKVSAIQESVDKYLTGVVSDYMASCSNTPGAPTYHGHPRYEQVYWTLDDEVFNGNVQVFTIWGNNDYRINCFGLTDDYILYTGGVNWTAFNTPDLTSRNNKMREGACVGDPVIPYTGEQTITENDFVDPANSNLDFKRFWLSGRAVPGDMKDKSFSSLGIGWTHNHEIGLFFRADGVMVADWLGGIYRFTETSPGSLNFNSSKPGASLTASHPANNPNSIEFKFKDGDTSYTYTFNSDGHPTQKYSNGALLLIYHYSNGRLSSVADPFGKTLQFNYDSDGKISTVTLPDQTQVTFSYEADGFLSSAHYQDGTQRIYLREDTKFTNLISGVKDEADFRFNYFKYDAYGRSVSTEFANGIGKYQLSYSKFVDVGQLQIDARITSPAGDYRFYGYSTKAGVVNITSTAIAPYDPVYPPIKSSVLSDDGLVLQNIDVLGVIDQIFWDTTRRLPLTETRASNNSTHSQTTQTEWHPSFRLPVKITETGVQGGQRITEYTYDTRGNRLSETVSGTGLTARTRNWTYTAQNLIASETDENTATTTHSYDQWGNRISTTDPLGRTTTYTYDAAGRVLSQTSPSSVVTTNTYDVRGRLLTQTTGGLTTTMTYLPTGLLASVQQPSGYQIDYQYDAAYRLTGWSDNRGNSGSYVLDDMGNRTSEQISDAQSQLAFQLNRTITVNINRVGSQTVGDNQISSYKYDANGDLISITTNNQSTTYGLDALRRLSTEKSPLNATATLTYNALGAVTSAKDFKGVTTTYTRDAQGNATQESSADIGSQQSSYDARGLNSSSQDAAGRSQQMQRDALGRPTALNASTSTTSLNSSFSYQSGTDQLSQIQEPHITTDYQRDSLGRVTRKSQSIGSN